MLKMAEEVKPALARVEASLPGSFPEPLWDSTRKGVLGQLHIFAGA